MIAGRGSIMSERITIATFNCENLFTRPRIFEESEERSLELLEDVARLQGELKKLVFDKDEIRRLKEKLSGYVTVNDIRGSTNTVNGARDWLGWVQFTKDRLDDQAVDNVARVITDVNADIICLVEVESRPALQRFHDDILKRKFLDQNGIRSYPYVMLIDGNDERGIDVAVMSRIPINWVRSHVHERTIYNGHDVPLFSRDCLEVNLALPGGQPLNLMVNHFKSMGYSPKNDPQSNRRRMEQAERVANLAGEHDLASEYLIVAGDFNSGSSGPSVAPLLDREGLYNVNNELPADERGTYRTGREQLDYLLVSDALKKVLESVHIERRGVYSTKWEHYLTVTNRRNEASDHAAVAAAFTL
jgi:endonuclease/exonuclease/phosphatase family metal-dependent hydrolase